MKVLFCLLSEQHMPNLLSVHHFQPEWCVFVESAGMKRRQAAKNFLNALQLGGRDYHERCLVQPLDHEDNLDEIRRALQQVYGKFPAEDWIVNLTGGTKPMSIAAYEFFKAVGARLFYVNLRAPNTLLRFDGLPSEICTHRPSAEEFLMGYGFESRKKNKNILQAEERARRWWDCARLIALSDPEPTLLNFGVPSSTSKDEARKKGIDLLPDQFGPASPEVCTAVQRTFDLKGSGNALFGRLDKYAVEFLTGGWLEVFLWGLLERHAPESGIWDVRLGMRPGKIDFATESEFDIAFMYDYGLWMIECKSGAQEHDPSVDVLYKLEAVVRQFRALRVRSCLATTSANVLDDQGILRPAIRIRASLYDCRVLIRSQIRQLAHDPDRLGLVHQFLFDTKEQT